MTTATPHGEPDTGFLTQLGADDRVRLGPCGHRVRLRRWANMLITPLRRPEQGSIGWRAFLFTTYLLGGYGALLQEEYSSKVTAVLDSDRRAGLDLRLVRLGDEPAWKITSFWAWPTGHSRGHEVISAVVAAADAAGATLLLNAANRHLVAGYYEPLGFVVRPGQEKSKRPWMVRPPGAARAEAVLAARPDVA